MRWTGVQEGVTKEMTFGQSPVGRGSQPRRWEEYRRRRAGEERCWACGRNGVVGMRASRRTLVGLRTLS